METEKLAPTAPKRPYVTPALVVHGDVQTLTHTIKVGTDPDGDGGGSFIPDGGT